MWTTSSPTKGKMNILELPNRQVEGQWALLLETVKVTQIWARQRLLDGHGERGANLQEHGKRVPNARRLRKGAFSQPAS